MAALVSSSLGATGHRKLDQLVYVKNVIKGKLLEVP
jgi:hypothetical protein